MDQVPGHLPHLGAHSDTQQLVKGVVNTLQTGKHPFTTKVNTPQSFSGPADSHDHDLNEWEPLWTSTESSSWSFSHSFNYLMRGFLMFQYLNLLLCLLADFVRADQLGSVHCLVGLQVLSVLSDVGPGPHATDASDVDVHDRVESIMPPSK